MKNVFIIVSLIFAIISCHREKKIDSVVIIAGDTEWKHAKSILKEEVSRENQREYIIVNKKDQKHIFIHSGWGKIRASAATEYAILKWNSDNIFSIGTCGGFRGFSKKYDLIHASNTITASRDDCPYPQRRFDREPRSRWRPPPSRHSPGHFPDVYHRWP